jgi:site-specific recombinase XerD
MKRAAQPALSMEGQQALDHYAHTFQQVEDLTAVTIRNYLSDLRQFIAWCKGYWCKEQDEQSFTPRAVIPPLLIRYRTYLQTTLWLKPSSINRALMSLKRYFAWAVRAQVIQYDPTSTVKFILSTYLETLPKGRIYLFPSEKTQAALTERALGHLITKYAQAAHMVDVSPHDLRHRFGYCMAEVVPLYRLAQIMGHDSLDTTLLYIRGTKQDLQHDVEKIAWT